MISGEARRRTTRECSFALNGWNGPVVVIGILGDCRKTDTLVSK